jgi:hypothetical protein
VWQVAASRNAVGDFAADLVAAGVEKVTVESTSDYWRIWFYLLEAAGLDVQLANARDVKERPRSAEDRQAGSAPTPPNRIGVPGRAEPACQLDGSAARPARRPAGRLMLGGSGSTWNVKHCHTAVGLDWMESSRVVVPMG